MMKMMKYDLGVGRGSTEFYDASHSKLHGHDYWLRIVKNVLVLGLD